MKKVLSLLFIFISVFFLETVPVKAYTPINDDCINKNTCILVCNYYNEYKYSGPKEKLNISLYYYLDKKEWKLYWEDMGMHPTKAGHMIHDKGPNPFDLVFSKKGENVYSSPKQSYDKFSCYKHAYLDFSDLNGSNELCFDNDGKTCKKNYNNIGTAFKTKYYLSDKKDYDFEDDLNAYVNTWQVGDINCNDLYNGTIKTSNYLSDKFEKDFKTNYLHGYEVPKFIYNNSAFENLKVKIETAVDSKNKECDTQINSDLSSGIIDEAEANRRRNELNSIDSSVIAGTFENYFNQLRENRLNSENWNQPDAVQCEDIFDFETPGAFGWLLQKIFNYIKIIGPILVVLLSSVDFIKAVVGFDEKAMKEAQNKLIIRLVAALALFLIPTLLQALMNLINLASQSACNLK